MYTRKDVEKITNIPSEIIGKYSIALEQINYKFETRNGTRLYFNKDISLLKKLHENFLDNERPLSEVTKETLTQMQQTNFGVNIPTSSDAIIISQNEKFDKFMDVIHTLTSQNEEIISINTQLLKQKEETEHELNIILGRLDKNERNRDIQLMTAIREMQETKRMIAATKQQTIFQKLKGNFTKKSIEE